MIDVADTSFHFAATPPPGEVAACPPGALLHAGFTHDPDVPVVALAASEGDRVLAVDPGGGGEAALAHLAVAGRVVAATTGDPVAFGAVLQLKAAAHGRLSRLDALRVLGVLRMPAPARRDVATCLVAAVPAPDRAFWLAHGAVLANGLFHGTAEVRLGRLLRTILRAHLPPDTYRKLLFGSRADRLATFAERLDRPGFWRQSLRLCMLRGRLADPAASALTRSDPVEALRRLVAAGLPSSPLWARAFCNDAGVARLLPAHLRPEGHAALWAHLPGLQVEARPAAEVLARSGSGLFDGVDLGNALDTLESGARRRLLAEAARVTRPGGRVVVASLDPMSVYGSVPAHLAPLPTVEDELDRRDRAPIWGRWCVFAVP